MSRRVCATCNTDTPIETPTFLAKVAAPTKRPFWRRFCTRRCVVAYFRQHPKYSRLDLIEPPRHPRKKVT